MSDYNNAVSGTDADVGHVTAAKVKNTLLLDAEREEDIEPFTDSAHRRSMRMRHGVYTPLRADRRTTL